MNARAGSLALLALLLCAPLAGALPGSAHEVHLRYAASEGPVGLALGGVTLSGASDGPLVALGVREARFATVPEVLLVHHEPGNESVETLRNVEVRTRGAGLLWASPDGVRLHAEVPSGAAFGVPGLALPTASGRGSDGNVTGVVLISSAGTLEAAPASGVDAHLTPFDARVTLLVDGAPLDGWDGRAVNPDASPSGGSEGIEWTLVLRGLYDATVQAAATVIPVPGEGAPEGVHVTLRASPDFDLSAVTDRMQALSRMQARGEGGFDPETLRQLGPAGSLLNGALVLVRPGAAQVPSADAAALGDASESLGQVTILRAHEIDARYGPGDEVAIDGNATYSFMNNRFTTESQVAEVAGFPAIAVGLWALALVATAASYVRRPRLREKTGFFTGVGIRTAATVIHLAVLAAVFVYWDGQFAESFGTSFLESLLGGVRDPITLAVTLGVQMSFWSLAAVAFALPVTLAIRMLLRMRGHGKAWKGFAKAVGLGALAFFGPAHALLLFNLILEYARLPMP